MTHVIEASNLSASVPMSGSRTLEILKSVSFSVAESESLAIVGRSGSGKSTLLTMLGLMAQPSGGSLKIRGAEVSRLSESKAASFRNENLGFVFQSYSLIAHLSVFENVQLPLMYGARSGRKVQKKMVMDALASVGLEDFAQRAPSQLSGGEQQRVAIARAMVRSPSIILADEPTGALDVETGESVIQLLTDAARQSTSCLIIVTHDLEIARSMNRCMVLQGGTLHEADAEIRAAR